MMSLDPEAIFEHYEDANFRLEVLAPELAELDYEVVMRNQARLQAFFTGIMDWPKADMTLAQNRLSLQQHKKEFTDNVAFAFGVYSSIDNVYIGSVYIDPSRVRGYDCELYYWLDERYLRQEQVLEKAICHWLQSSWGIRRIALVGRSIPLSTWASK